MTVLNELDRFHLASDVIDRVPRLGDTAGHQKQMLRDKLIEHRLYVHEYGDDMPEVKDWQWGARSTNLQTEPRPPGSGPA
jgi:xylulose-5-phosphate/fructose-6-phosphate phosphoketolase